MNEIFFVVSAVASVVSAQTVYLAGDSTMAKGGGGAGTDGWGQYLSQYLTLPVVNMAVGGTSARSYTDQGRFTTIINTVKAGDFVVIEFGHNDGSAGAVDNGNQDAVGNDTTTTATVVNSSGKSIVIHTFNFYIQNAVNSLKAKGAIPIVSSQTPDNLWTNGAIGAPPRFVGYAQLAGSRTGVTFVDHYAYVAQEFDSLGQTTTTTFFPNNQHLHTSPAGAQVVAAAFVRGLACSKSTLASKISTAGKAVPGKCI